MALTQLLHTLRLLVLAALGTAAAHAGDLHTNRVDLRKEAANLLRFEFQINPAPWLHQLLAPQASFPAFVKASAELPEPEFRKAFEKAAKKFESGSFLLTPNGEKVLLGKWQMPEAARLHDMLRKNALILDLPPQIQGHLEPIVISASARSRQPLGRIQLTLSPVFYPVQAHYQQDSVWFTPMLQTSLMDLY